MTSRILPPEEWPRLKTETDVEAVMAGSIEHCAPQNTVVIVVEDAGRIVGCQLLMTVLHAEGLWVHPDHRGKASVIRRLWPAIRATVRQLGCNGFLTSTSEPGVCAVLRHLGAQPLPGETYAVKGVI